MLRVLVVEDEPPISDLICMNLSQRGYDCTAALDGEQALALIGANPYDLILLDIMLPKMDGYALMDHIRPKDIPVIFLTAKGTVEDRVKGLKRGADDYLVKPFEIVELLARVEAVLRRYHKGEAQLVVDDVQIDLESRVVKKCGEPVELTMKEFQLLLLFVQNRNIALFREVIFEKVWESDFLGDTRTVDLHVQRLRKKLDWSDRIKSIYKVGYRLEA